MTNHLAGLAANSLPLLAAFVILILSSATPLFAQRGGRNRTVETARTNQDALNEWRRTHLKEEIEKQFRQKRISLFPLIKEDFTRIQIVNNAMMRKVFDDEVLDYKDISDHLTEIKRRAQRLKENLMLPEGEEKEKLQRLLNAAAGNQVRESLLTLDTLIMGFVKNPLFQRPGVIDAKLSAQAARDLKTIIEFSGSIKKEIERISKLQSKP
jgi:phosphopantothenoylcysteine synthetase/decarboxylase